MFRTKNARAKSIEGVFADLKIKFEDNNVKVFSEYWETNFILFYLKVLFSGKKIYHVTGDIYFATIFLKLAFKKVVVTFHDLGHYKNLSGLKRVLYFIFWIYLPLKLSDQSIFVSEFTRKDVIRYSGLKLTKSPVVYNPATELFNYSFVDFNYSNPSILLIGTDVHKNIEAVFRALKGKRCKLLIVGRLDLNQVEMLNEFSLMYENCFNISVSEIVELYRKCDIVSFVSLHEGFGLPILEAQMSSKVLICSNVCSLPEVAGLGAIYVDPLNVSELTDAFDFVFNMDNKDVVKAIIHNGRLNLLRFKSSDIAQKYIDIYRGVIK